MQSSLKAEKNTSVTETAIRQFAFYNSKHKFKSDKLYFESNVLYKISTFLLTAHRTGAVVG